MTRQEFLDALRRALNRDLSAEEVEENIAYYDSYISSQVREGQEEAQVIARLGDPRLIARTILQVDENRTSDRASVHTFHVSGWKVTAVLIVLLLLVCVIVGTVAAVVWRLLPVLLVVGAALWIYHRFFY